MERVAFQVLDCKLGLVPGDPTWTGGVKAHDPNHLYLGCRFHGGVIRSAGAFRAAGKHCDVVSINYYNAWTPDSKLMASWEQWSGKPFMITEFYAKGVNSEMLNTSGAG